MCSCANLWGTWEGEDTTADDMFYNTIYLLQVCVLAPKLPPSTIFSLAKILPPSTILLRQICHRLQMSGKHLRDTMWDARACRDPYVHIVSNGAQQIWQFAIMATSSFASLHVLCNHAFRMQSFNAGFHFENAMWRFDEENDANDARPWLMWQLLGGKSTRTQKNGVTT